MRAAIKADERLPFEELFFDKTFDTPLNREKAGNLFLPLEMVRLAPSAINKQPWRLLVCDGIVHFYLRRNYGNRPEGKPDMQTIDMGIALCHFDLTAKECGINIEFVQEDPNIPCGEMEYIASYRIIG